MAPAGCLTWLRAACVSRGTLWFTRRSISAANARLTCGPARARWPSLIRGARWRFESGERVRYERTGAGDRSALRYQCGVAGANQPHVFTLHTLDDAARLRNFITEKHPRRAVVAGAGYIGVEAADALRRHGIQVTMLESSPYAHRRAKTRLLRRPSGRNWSSTESSFAVA